MYGAGPVCWLREPRLSVPAAGCASRMPPHKSAAEIANLLANESVPLIAVTPEHAMIAIDWVYTLISAVLLNDKENDGL